MDLSIIQPRIPINSKRILISDKFIVIIISNIQVKNFQFPTFHLNPKMASDLKKHDEWRTGPKQNFNETLKPEELPNILEKNSLLGPEWTGIFEIGVDFNADHYLQAMENLINNPNINSTVILRSDVLRKFTYDGAGVQLDEEISEKINEELIINGFEEIEGEEILMRNVSDTELRLVPLPITFKPYLQFVRRMIPRNPSKDYIINQTCSIMKSDDMILVLYTPHISSPDENPFYLPPTKSIGILFNETTSKLSIHYLPFDSQETNIYRNLEPCDRPIRIAYRLLNTSKKHSCGVKTGYQKRVNHDQVVEKQAFQDTYILLKQKHAKHLVDTWTESTDPRKHVFEDIAIAAFLIELWRKIYISKDVFEFRDLGCGNGILVYILLQEGYKGEGIDARERKSWLNYPDNIKENLKEQVIIPSALLRPHPLMYAQNPHLIDNGQEWKVPIHTKPQHQGNTKISTKQTQIVECYTSNELLNDPKICPAEFPPNTFVIGNHSDELTCWLPLLGYPFMVIPCCSHNLNGDKIRYSVSKKNIDKGNSRYQGLVDHVELLASMCGWDVEREMLRIPSTRNAAVIGYKPSEILGRSVYEIIAMEGGATKWIENTMSLMKKPPRNH